MSFRRVDVAIVMLALSFPTATFAAGVLGLSEFWFLMLALCGVGLWAWWQQRQLGELKFMQRAIRGFIAYALIGFTLLIAFELGQFLGGYSELSPD